MYMNMEIQKQPSSLTTYKILHYHSNHNGTLDKGQWDILLSPEHDLSKTVPSYQYKHNQTL